MGWQNILKEKPANDSRVLSFLGLVGGKEGVEYIGLFFFFVTQHK